MGVLQGKSPFSLDAIAASDWWQQSGSFQKARAMNPQIPISPPDSYRDESNARS